MGRKFTEIDEEFVCENCGEKVKPLGYSCRNHCPKCLHTLKCHELIPIISFIIQKGKCKNCHTKLSFFYPFTELATGLLFVIIYYSFGFSYDLIIALILVSVFVLVIVSDLSYLLIPDSFILIPSILILIITIRFRMTM